MTTRISTLLAAVAALGAAAVFTAPAQAGTGPGPNFQQFPSYRQYSHTSSYQTSGSRSEWNRGGQIQNPSYDPAGADFHGR